MGDLSPEGVVCLQSVYFVNKGTKPAATVDDSTYLTIFLPFKLSNVKKSLISFVSVSHQMPLPSGQSRAMPAQVSRGETGLSNRK